MLNTSVVNFYDNFGLIFKSSGDIAIEKLSAFDQLIN